MQVSIKWLNDYIKFNETAEELADKYTMSGVPVENVIRADEGLDKVVTGRITEIKPHPDSDHLQICQMRIRGRLFLEVRTRVFHQFAQQRRLYFEFHLLVLHP